MDNFVIVRNEYLNQYGYLFGGIMLKWVDEFGWIAATRDFPRCHFVTVALDQIQFKEQVVNGAILRFHSERTKTGNTSCEYEINVFATEGENFIEKKVFRTNITFVNVDKEGKKRKLIT